jgi:microcystin-dependent protein
MAIANWDEFKLERFILDFLATRGGEVPVGTIVLYAGATAPPGWMLCDGTVSSISRTAYAALFKVIGTTYGVGDGSTTFGLPNLRDRMPVGKGSGSGTDTLGEQGGELSHSLVLAEMPSHRHASEGGGYFFQTGAGDNAGLVAPSNGYNKALNTDYAGGAFAGSDGNAHNNMPPYTTLNFIIKVA